MTITDIFAETRDIVDATSSDYTDAKLLRRVNAAYEETVGKLIALDRNWSFGDSNYSALPTGTQTLTADVREYAFNSALLTLLRVEIKDSNGLWRKLIPIDESDVSVALPEFLKTSGLPQYYAKRENFIVLYPAPSAAEVTLTSGLNSYFQRTADVFTTAQVATGTKTPGFASPYHVLLAYKAALPYAMSYKKDRVPLIRAEIERLEKELVKFYGQRSKEVRNIMTAKPILFR